MSDPWQPPAQPPVPPPPPPASPAPAAPPQPQDQTQPRPQSEAQPQPAWATQPAPQYQVPPPPQWPQVPQPGYGMAPYQAGPPPIGKVRPTGICILLFFVTLGIYGYVWYYQTHDEMKRHSGQGIGGGIALLLAFLVSIVMPYLTSSEVGQLYTRRGQHPPVTGLTGLWNFPGVFILVGPIIWFVKTNGALNDYWRSVGAA
jgi:hypothetical protein